MFSSSSFTPINNTPRSISPPPIKPIFTNKIKNGKRPLDENENETENENERYTKNKKKL